MTVSSSGSQKAACRNWHQAARLASMAVRTLSMPPGSPAAGPAGAAPRRRSGQWRQTGRTATGRSRQGMGIGRRMGRHKLHGRRADLLHDNRDRLCALHGLLHGQRCAAGRAETGGGVVRRSAFRTKHGKSPSVRFCLQYNETGAPCQCVLYENAFLLA